MSYNTMIPFPNRSLMSGLPTASMSNLSPAQMVRRASSMGRNDTHSASCNSTEYLGCPTPPYSVCDRRTSTMTSFSDLSYSSPANVPSVPVTPASSMNSQAGVATRHWSEDPELLFTDSSILPLGHSEGYCSVPEVNNPFYQLSSNGRDEDLPSSIYPLPYQVFPRNAYGMGAMHNALMQHDITGLQSGNFTSADNPYMYTLPEAAYNFNDYSNLTLPAPNQGFDAFSQNFTQRQYGMPRAQSVVPMPRPTQEVTAADHFRDLLDARPCSGGAASDASSVLSSAWESFSRLGSLPAGIVDEKSIPSHKGSSYSQTHRSSRLHAGDRQRQRRQSAKRAGKRSQSRATFSEYTQKNQDHPFDLESDDDGSVIQVKPRASLCDDKPHRCPYVAPDGTACESSFERSEHLKRHMGKHTDERPYPCPLPGCNKKIGRPDNATDHFKTHLNKDSKGKRNKHCSWAVLEQAIIARYPQKKADKFRQNLRKYIATQDPAKFA